MGNEAAQDMNLILPSNLPSMPGTNINSPKPTIPNDPQPAASAGVIALPVH
jgi:hypothetical protein